MNAQNSFIYRETFFRPDEYGQEAWTIPAALYNRAYLLLTKAKSKCVFVPIRAMQYLAVVDQEEIVFVDGAGSYRYQTNGQGGRVIELAWRDFHPQQRKSLAEPVPCQVVYYLQSAPVTMKRIVREFQEAIILLERRQPQPTAVVQILSWPV